ncbi:translation factor [Thermococcus argininiproducens]|uniref:Translation factor n=1 Tax=Thermococcus argininiproducens TaxID=2866384 RepID=A0A9E7MAL4_9EURY|nr:tRNA-binding protein Pbp11 [Thermococcus argininiproducens]USG99972.1 translation factor [Thermococcus argininiproducens]
MRILERFFKRERVEIFSRKPVGRFKVEEVLNILGKQVIIGEVLEGVIYPGYKLKGRGVALIREIQKDRKKVDFALEYDRVGLVLEGTLGVEGEEILEVYQA